MLTTPTVPMIIANLLRRQQTCPVNQFTFDVWCLDMANQTQFDLSKLYAKAIICISHVKIT